MRILMINPNTTAAMTDKMVAEARRIVPAGTIVVGATGRFGGQYVATRATYAIAGHAALDAYAEHGADADVVALSCFGDPALFALREVAHQPVVGMAEAACMEALRTGGKFAIVTGGERWKPMLEEFVSLIDLSAHLAGIRTVAPTGGDIARDPEGSLNLLAEACCAAADDFGASSVILGGAGLAGLAERIAHRVHVPLIDSVHAVIRRSLEVATTASTLPRPEKPRPLEIATTGLGIELSAILRSH